MRTPTVVRLPVKNAFLWANFRATIEDRLAEVGDTRPLPDSEIFALALDCALLFAARGKAAEVHATKNSDALSWIRIETEIIPMRKKLGIQIAETREKLNALEAAYEKWAEADTEKG